MSELFAVRVANVTTESATLEVRSVHPDSGPPAATATFALMLIYDPIMSSGYSEMKRFTHLEASPLANEVDRDNYLDPTWLRQNAAAFVANAVIEGDAGNILEVFPTHPAWIEHLRKGMAWETAAYDAGPGDAAAPRAPSSGDSAAHSTDPAAGFRIGKPQTFPDEGSEIEEAFIPLHGPNMYVADPVLTGDAMKAIVDMAGQPILVVPQRGPKEVGVVLGPEENWFCLYHEKGGGYGYHSITLSEMKSIGRAWLKEDGAASSSNGVSAAPAATVANKPAAKAKPAKKSAKKSAAKKPAAKAKPAKKSAAKKLAAKAKPAKRSAAKKPAAKAKGAAKKSKAKAKR